MTTPANNWQPISTAPKDGTAILVYIGGNIEAVAVTQWEDGAWSWPDYVRYQPTHWQPLPEPPQ